MIPQDDVQLKANRSSDRTRNAGHDNGSVETIIRRHRTGILLKIDRWATVVAIIAMVAAFWVDVPSSFGTMRNLDAILNESTVIVLLCVGLTMVVAVGEFDLAFPYSMGLTGGVATITMVDYKVGTVLAIILAIVAGVVTGIIGGAVVSTRRASSFIITLALGFVWLGIAEGITGNRTIDGPFSSSFLNLAAPILGGLTLPVYLCLGYGLVVALILRYTIIGRHSRAVGSNAIASNLAGLRLTRIRIFAFAIMGLGVGLAGIVLTAQQASFAATQGESYFLAPYVAVFFGMSMMRGRKANVFGSVAGALFIGVLQVGLILVSLPSWIALAIEGMVLLVIVSSTSQKWLNA